MGCGDHRLLVRLVVAFVWGCGVSAVDEWLSLVEVVERAALAIG